MRRANLLKNLDLLDIRNLRPVEIPILVSLLLLAFYWRLCGYMWRAIWLDEAYTLMIASMHHPHHTILFSNLYNTTPGLYELIVYLVGKWVGYKVEYIRLISVFFSSLSTYFVYRALRDWYGTFAGLIGSILFIYQNYSVSFAHEIRNYALLGCFVLWLFGHSGGG